MSSLFDQFLLLFTNLYLFVFFCVYFSLSLPLLCPLLVFLSISGPLSFCLFLARCPFLSLTLSLSLCWSLFLSFSYISLVITDESCLGQAGVVYEHVLGENKFTFVEECKNPLSVTILMKGPNKHSLNQVMELGNVVHLNFPK